MDELRLRAFRDNLIGLRDELRSLPGGAALTDASRRVLLECLALLGEIAGMLRELSLAKVLPRWVGGMLAPLLGLVVKIARQKLEDTDGV